MNILLTQTVMGNHHWLVPAVVASPCAIILQVEFRKRSKKSPFKELQSYPKRRSRPRERTGTVDFIYC